MTPTRDTVIMQKLMISGSASLNSKLVRYDYIFFLEKMYKIKD